MNRKLFLKIMGTLPIASQALANETLKKLFETKSDDLVMPTMFVGHGSPMNAIQDNEFTNEWKKIGLAMPTPKAILCISAHWETKGTFVTAMEKPKTIHDFGGFPQALFDVQYPAPGSIDLANEIHQSVTNNNIGLNQDWGLDHGTWSILKPMFPKANIPVLQLSIDNTKDAQYHYSLAKELYKLRSRGVLIIGSGNIIHNLGLVDWNKLNVPNYGYEWALEIREIINKNIIEGNHDALINYEKLNASAKLAIPSPEHYIPLLYVLALQQKNEAVTFFNDKAVGGSLTMTSIIVK
jgi:4,5-DOPA dioxygenase extradiol